ncbi:MAG: hypothetical protein R2939_04255 [Kofleriaceae bacterium]
MKSTLGIVAALVLATGCGKSKGDEGGGGGKSPSGAAAGPAVDCPAFEAKLKECQDPFLAAYAKTEAAINAGKQTMDGPGDGAKGAEYYKMGITGGLIGKICTEQYADRDPRWRVRMTACTGKASCDEWSACMAPAIGDPLPPP